MMFKSKLSLVMLIVISLLGCCMEVDISIPSFPSMMAFFSASEAQVQNTLSLNFLAFCFSGLFYGPLSERYGRRGLMLFGATCFLMGALGCVFASSIYQLMFWRFIQGLGASSTCVLGFTMISDTYNQEQSARYIGKINAYVTIFMSLAPILGSMIINYCSSWRANFIVIAIIAFIAWFFLMWQLPETHLTRKAIKIKSILKDYSSLLAHKQFMILAAIPNILVTAYLTFVGSAAFYYLNSCQLSYFEYALHQGLVVFSFSMMSFYADKWVIKLGAKNVVNLGMGLCFLGTVLLCIFAFAFPFEPKLITFSMCLFSLGAAFPMSVTFAQSLDCVPHLRGVSSSFIMSSRLLISSLAIAYTGYAFDGSMRPVAWVNGVAITLSLLLYARLILNREPVLAKS
jgi:DHA1 family bicyclomycin/chloramphenicol resistance-like MFS transporter